MEISKVPHFVPTQQNIELKTDDEFFNLDLDISTVNYQNVSRPWNTKNNTCPHTCHCESEFGTCTCQ